MADGGAVAPGAGAAKAHWYRLDQIVQIDRGQFFALMISVVFGGIVGWAISAVATAPKRLELWAVLVAALISLAVCIVVIAFLGAFQREGRDRLKAIDDSVQMMKQSLDLVEHSVSESMDSSLRSITESLGAVEKSVTESIDGSAILIPRELIYPEMARCIRNAETQVVVLTYYMYDWENDKRTFGPSVAGTVPGVEEFYDAIYACITNPKVDYLRVWQVQADYVDQARSKIEEEERLRREIQLIEETAADHPDWCKLKIIQAATTASIILIDRKTLFFNIDLFDTGRGQWMSPFMLMVRDARGNTFEDFKRVIASLTN